MNKRGSHIEIIISFVIFITFLIFIFVVINPKLSVQNEKEESISYIENAILERISAEMKIITIKLEFVLGMPCIELTDLLTNLEIGTNLIIKDEEDNLLESTSDGTSLQITRGDISDDFFKIYYSSEFNELESGSGCFPRDYELGLVKEEKHIFESNIIDLIKEYENYEELKEEFNIPKDIDFGYGIKLSNGTILETEEKNISTNIYLKETPVIYINSEGNMESGFLRIIVW